MKPREALPCPDCGLVVPGDEGPSNPRERCLSVLHTLSTVTLSSVDPRFPHQLLVDTYAVQHWRTLKPIGVLFGLFGLLLVAEHGFSGREVQLAHVELSRQKPVGGWPAITVPDVAWSKTMPLDLQPTDDVYAVLSDWARATWSDVSLLRENVWPFAAPFVAGK